MILLCKELRVHACSNTALYPQGLVQTTLILSAGISSAREIWKVNILTRQESGGQRDLAPFVVDSYAMAWMDKNVYL